MLFDPKFSQNFIKNIEVQLLIKTKYLNSLTSLRNKVSFEQNIFARRSIQEIKPDFQFIGQTA